MKTGLRRLHYFSKLCEILNFHRTAETLGITQPTLSRAISQLEGEIGFALFVRDNRNVALTDAGLAFWGGAQNTLDVLEDAVLRAAKIAEGKGGNLFIGYTGIAISGKSSAFIREFRQCYPDVRFNLRAAWSEAQIDLLKLGSIDVGFVTGAIPDDELDHFCIQRDPLHVLLPAQNPLTNKPHLHMRDLKSEEFILGDVSRWRIYNDHLFGLCRKAGFEPKQFQTGPDTASILGLVGCGMGITVLPSSIRPYDGSATVGRPIEDCSDMLETHAIWRKNESRELVKTFVDFLKEFRPTD